MSEHHIVLVSEHTERIRDLLDWMLDRPGGVAPKWEVVDVILDYGNLGFDEAAVAHYVLVKLPLGPARSALSFAEIDSALSELETP